MWRGGGTPWEKAREALGNERAWHCTSRRCQADPHRVWESAEDRRPHRAVSGPCPCAPKGLLARHCKPWSERALGGGSCSWGGRGAWGPGVRGRVRSLPSAWPPRPRPQGICEEVLSSWLFSGCRTLVDASSYVQACRQDLCLCEHANRTSCICPTLAEYSRQCTHAGGLPLDWRGPHLCRECPPRAALPGPGGRGRR